MTSLLLLAAHMVGDYILQTDYMAANKLTNTWVRALHVTLYCLPFIAVALVIGTAVQETSWFILAVWVTHFITDTRRWASGDKWPPKPIIVDQTIHAVCLAVLGFIFLPK